MARNSQQRRSPEEIRAGSVRLGLILLAVVAAFFVAIFVKQSFFHDGWLLPKDVNAITLSFTFFELNTLAPVTSGPVGQADQAAAARINPS